MRQIDVDTKNVIISLKSQIEAKHSTITRQDEIIKELKEDGERLLVGKIYDNDTQMIGAKCAYCYAEGVFNHDTLEYEFEHESDCTIALHTALIAKLEKREG
jgi:hypothetical protein